MISTRLRILIFAMLAALSCTSDANGFCRNNACIYATDTTVDRSDDTTMMQHRLHVSQAAEADETETLEFSGLSSWKTKYSFLFDGPLWGRIPMLEAQARQITKHDQYDLGLLSLKVKSLSAIEAGGLAAYLVSFALGGLLITLVYWSHGALAISKVLGYIACGSMITLSVKLVYHDSFGFKYPWLLTTFHMLSSAIVGFTILFHRKYFQGQHIHIPTLTELGINLLPLCIGMTCSVGFANGALMYCSVAFAEIIGSSTPFFSILIMVLLRMPFNWYLLLPLSGIVFGCMGTVMGTVHFSVWGLVLLLLANLGRATKAVLQQWIMTGKLQERYDPATLLAWQCLINCPITLVWSACTEGIPAVAALSQQAHPAIFFGVVATSCAIAAALNTFHILVVQDLGAVGIQATSQLKQGLIVMGGVVLFGEVLTPIVTLSAAIVLLSAFWYARASSNAKREKEEG